METDTLKIDEKNTKQCQYCAFMLSEDQSTKEEARLIEKKYRITRGAKGVPKKTRDVFVGGTDDRTETCFINSPMWEKMKDNVHCPDFLDRTLPLSEALTLREARLGNKTALEAKDIALAANDIALAAKTWAIIAAIIATIAIAIPILLE